MKRRRWLIIIAMVFTGLYVAGYAHVRHEKLLIHRSAYVNGLTDSHEISRGDFISWGGPDHAGISWWVFTPLRFAETRYWYLRYPPRSPWPYS